MSFPVPEKSTVPPSTTTATTTIQPPTTTDYITQPHDSPTSTTEVAGNINTLRPRQNRRHFPGDIFKCIFFNEDVWISIKISLNFVPMGPVNNIPALVQIMAWRQAGDKPLSEPMLFRSLMHIYASLGLNELTQWSLDKNFAILQTFSNAFSSMKTFKF